MQLLATPPFALQPTEHAFTLDTGETAVVDVRPQPYTPAQPKVDIFVAARLVDPQTGVTLQENGHDVACPSHTYSMTADLLANGGDLTVLVADGMQEQAERVRRTRAALQALAALTGRAAAG